MKLLIIEDDLDLCSFIEYPLKCQGFEIDFCHIGSEAFLYLNTNVYDVVILDRMLPEMDGIQILKKMRKEKIKTPVIMATALNSVTNRIEGLDSGADDYITKPFETSELIARIRAQARRNGYLADKNILTYGDLTLDCDLMELSTELSTELSDETYRCSLSKREYDLFTFFLQNQDKVLTRQLLLDRIWGLDSFVTEGNIDNFIFFLRKRLKSVHSKVTIKNIRGVGYRLEIPHD